MSYVVEDASGTRIGAHPQLGLPPRREDIHRALSRIMASAEGGAVVSVTITSTGNTVTLAGPGGAFDARAETPSPVIRDGITSPATDAVDVTPGAPLPSKCRALFVGGAGNLYVRMAGSPETVKGPLAVQAGQVLPLQVVEVTGGPRQRRY
ncbi:hypothetical protein [Poseidonocella sp. HB161398]|uniref:spike base protein, RCAP_Rcc01079 family n=1 Tax=Poseidonocella sp. HB161398 TaxID=2320855 RepID=UPI001108DB2B|nr:hypothetical protein [Poseidonocella sp. HB161398]